MDIPLPAKLLDRVGSLPAGRPLVERLGAHPNVYLVGGAVRDLLLGESPTDLDLVVEGEGQALAADLGGRGVRHERFGTWTVALAGHFYDIAQARREIYPHPGALPEVAPATLSEDLTRRDFTVNAMAVALGGPQAGALTAAPHALEDLELGRLRVLHDRSFQDDPTRLLRLARYASRLGFQTEPHTAKLLTDALADRALDSVSGARIGAELRLLVAEPAPLAALRMLGDLGLAQAIHPRFGLGPGEAGLAGRALSLLPADMPRDLLVLALAARAVPASELRELLDRLAFEATDRDVIVAAATRSEEVAQGLAGAQRPSEVAEIAAGAPPELVALAGALGPQDAARSWLDHLRHVRLEIAGADLLEAGVEQGPAVGRGLRAALAAKLDGRVQSREAELGVALEAARAAG
jgi:tRNA nucleotidyltransferase (CCA-adding enzyme)